MLLTTLQVILLSLKIWSIYSNQNESKKFILGIS